MRHWVAFSFTILLVALFLFALIQNGRSLSDPTTVGSETDAIHLENLERKETIVEPIAEEKPVESVPLGELVRTVGIREMNEQDSRSLAFYDNVRQYERTFRFEWQHIQITLEIGKEYRDQVITGLSQIKLKGDGEIETQIRDFPNADYLDVYVDVTNIQGDFILQIEGMPPITFNPMEIPFAYSLNEESIKGPHLVFYRDSQAVDLLVVGPKENHAVYAFSQEIDPRFAEISIHGDAEGEWLDHQHYQVRWQPQSESHYIQVYFKGVYAIDGSTIIQQRTSGIRIIPERAWATYPSGEIVGFSEYDMFYDFLLFSPNKKRYLGLFDRSGAHADGAGIFSDIFLEEEGKEPVRVTNTSWSQFTLSRPMFWLNDDEFLYWNSKELIHFNADTLQQTILLETYDRDTWTIDEVVNDAYESSVYVVTSYYGGEEQNTRIREYLYYNVDTGKLEELRSDHTFFPLATILETIGTGSIQQSFIREEGGYFISSGQEGTYTTFLGRDGQYKRVTGELVHILDDSFLIRRRDMNEGKQQSELVIIRDDEETAVSTPPGNLRVFGEYVITAAFAEGGKSYRIYDVGTNRWKALNEIPQDVDLHYQTIDSLYRQNLQ